MSKRPLDDSPARMRKLWLACEYPGRIVLRDVARFLWKLKRAGAALTRRSQFSPSKEESEDYLWAERRE